jgi:hypothetical protein
MSYEPLLLLKIEGALEEVNHWERLRVTDPEMLALSSRGFRGRSRDWSFILSDFSIENQGFPPGSRGYVATAADGYAIIHLPHELAQKAIELAERRS